MKSYKFTDRKEVVSRIEDAHKVAVAYANQVHLLTGRFSPVWNLEDAVSAYDRKLTNHIGQQSKYVPHQGKKECERRMNRLQTAN